MTPLQSLYDDAIFHLSDLALSEVFDLLLVTLVFYLLLRLIRRSRSAFLLRGALVLGVLLFLVSVLLPLPAFDWLVRMALVAMFVTTPIIFQPEVRRLLERLGRSTGLARAVRQTSTEHLIPRIVRAVENMSDSQTGALIVIEGNELLHGVIETGVPIHGQVTSELLQTIFYPDNPLHDGAAVLREDRVVAAGCVLPLTERVLGFQRRLGTRHRAALGMSETSRAMAIIVSEETGDVSVARDGVLQYQLDRATLREQLFDFYVPDTPTDPVIPVWRLIMQALRSIWRRPAIPTLNQLWSSLGLLFVSLLLALVVWTFVLDQTNPARRALIEDIPLKVENVPPGTALITPPPASVSAIIQTTGNILETLSRDSFQAVVSLKDLPPGLHHPEIQVNSGSPQVRILSVTPSALDLELAPIISRTMAVAINLPDAQNLSPAYEMVGLPTAFPEQVQLVGPVPDVEQVSQVQATMSVANANTSLRETRPLRALDEAGREVTGVSLQPTQVQVNVPIRRRLNALDVGVRAVITGTLPPGYWLSGLSVNPNGVTLRGNRDQLAEMNGFVDTLAVDISQATGDLSVDIPLDLPPGVQAVDSEGDLIKTVSVLARVAPRQGDLAVTRPVELIGSSPGITATLNPAQIDLLLSGPLPILNQIAVDPSLVRVLVDASNAPASQATDLTPTVLAPEGIRAQLVPPSVLVTLTQ